MIYLYSIGMIVLAGFLSFGVIKLMDYFDGGDE